MKTSSISRRRRIGCLALGVFLGGGMVALALLYSMAAARLPMDAPLARMYRTEADLALLKAAMDAYFTVHAAYPLAGPDGLRAATAEFGKSKNYLPQGPPLDAWSRQFYYIPAARYAEPESVALRGPQGYLAPDTYQIFSAGADGVSQTLPDNITSWDSGKAWRDLYRGMNREFMRQPGKKR